MRIGYARVSTTDQNLDIQIEALKKSGCQRIFQEKVSGAKKKREELEKLLEQLRPQDTLVVWKLDRLARSTYHLLEIVDRIREKEASFLSISEPWADTTSPAGKMIMTVFAGIAEFERNLIHERTHTGRVEAKKRGVKFGRPSKIDTEKKEIILKLIEEGKSIQEIAKAFNLHKTTIYRNIGV